MEGLLWNAASSACMQQLVAPSVSIRKNRYADSQHVASSLKASHNNRKDGTLSPG